MEQRWRTRGSRCGEADEAKAAGSRNEVGRLILLWAVLSLIYGFGALVLIGLAFGREENELHLLSFAGALVRWPAVSFAADEHAAQA